MKSLRTIILLILFSLNSLASLASLANAQLASTTPEKESLARAAVLNQLCTLVSADPSFAYEDLFHESFRKKVSKANVSEVLSTIAITHGSCTGVTDFAPFSPYTTENDIGLLLTDGYAAVFRLNTELAPGSRYGALITGLIFGGSTLQPDRMEVSESYVTTRDGVKLRTLVFKAPGAQRLPTVLTRTPYFNIHSKFLFGSHFATASYFVSRGYSFVLQAVRGTAGSTGEPKLFNPQEITDGSDTVQWIASQNFSNGKIAAVGTSYEGLTAAATGVENPPGLELVMAGAGPTSSGTGTFNLNGPLNLSVLDYIRYFTRGESTPFTNDVLSQKILAVASNELDLRKYDELVFGVAIPEWKLWAEAYADKDSPFWRERNFTHRLPEIKVPTYHIAGTESDGNMPDTIQNFIEVERHSPHRSQHHLILGYWGHGNNTPNGDGSNLLPFWAERFDKILAYYLKGESTSYVSESRVRVQSHFSNDFLSASSFPIPVTNTLELFFGAQDQNGKAQTILTPSPLNSIPFSEYAFRPLDLSKRDDQALTFTYTSNRELAFNGPIQLELFISIDVPQAEVVVSFAKQDRTGAERFVTACAFGSRFVGIGTHTLKSNDCPVFAQLNQGETLLVAVGSNYFPTLARNTGNESAVFYSAQPKDATIRVLHGKLHQSRIRFALEANPLNRLSQPLSNRMNELKTQQPLRLPDSILRGQ